MNTDKPLVIWLDSFMQSIRIMKRCSRPMVPWTIKGMIGRMATTWRCFLSFIWQQPRLTCHILIKGIKAVSLLQSVCSKSSPPTGPQRRNKHPGQSEKLRIHRIIQQGLHKADRNAKRDRLPFLEKPVSFLDVSRRCSPHTQSDREVLPGPSSQRVYKAIFYQLRE